jgi:hypothetical protein
VRLTTSPGKKLIVTKAYEGGQGPARAVAPSKKKKKKVIGKTFTMKTLTCTYNVVSDI